MKKTAKVLMAITSILLAIYGCNGKSNEQKSNELMRDSVPNDTTTIQYRDTNSSESRGDIPPTPQPDTSSKK